MTRSFRVLYIVLFLAMLLVLGLWSTRSFFGFSTNADATVLNGRWTKAVETHYDDEFPIKRIGTNLWAALDYKLFNEGRPGVVQGRDVGAVVLAEGAGVVADESARGAVAAQRLLQVDVAFLRRVARIRFDGAAQVAGRRGPEVAGAGGQHHAADVLAEQHFGVTRQARLGVSHGREGLGIVRRTPGTVTAWPSTMRGW